MTKSSSWRRSVASLNLRFMRVFDSMGGRKMILWADNFSERVWRKGKILSRKIQFGARAFGVGPTYLSR